MASQSRQKGSGKKKAGEQKEVVERVMHEFKHGDLETHGRTVKDRKQAIAIALREAGASKYETPKKNRENLKRTQEREGEREQSRADLYAEAKRRNIPGRSKMTKEDLKQALHGA
jgi:hypothetical protein